MYEIADDSRPLLLEVGEDTWSVIPLEGKPTEREEWLFELLNGMGGIKQSVPPGKYHFNAIPHGKDEHKVVFNMINN